MGKIHILDKAVAELIAAGEVVERPASIVKELLENSIDAGATNIFVEIQGGGIRLIRITDNGCGIERDDIPRAFLRHATSKVQGADDLTSIHTLGFRGEALASIAAMCRVELTTKTAAETEGSTYKVSGGELDDFAPAGCPTGTTIIVRDIFFNTPARMKFLKKDVSEGTNVGQVVEKCALSHPEIAFKFIRDGQTKLQTSGNGDLLSVIYAIYSREFANEMMAVDYTTDQNIRVSGYLSKPSGAKPSRTYQSFFINRRYVRTRTASAALEEACKTKLMVGKFPACVLNLELDASTVDVNVHPAKIEVRFAQEKPIFNAVYFAVKSVLSKLEQPITAATPAAPIPAKKTINELTLHLPQQEYPQQHLTAQEFRTLFAGGEKQGGSFSKPVAFSTSRLDISVEDEPEVEMVGNNSFYDKKPPPDYSKIFAEPATKPANTATVMLDRTIISPPSKSEPEQKTEETPYRLIGELFGTYIVMEKETAMLLVDKHAAHERLLYEKLKQDLSYGNRQVLLSAQAVSLPPEQYDAVLENLNVIEGMGFCVEDFGGSTVLVREIPIELGARDVEVILSDIAAKLVSGHQDLTPAALDRLYYSIACKSAIKAHDKSSKAELDELIRRLGENPQITHCPHGRPVSVSLSKYELEKMFGRLG